MRIRFGERFEMDLDIEESVLDFPIVPFVFQPLVENALSHGFRDLDRDGRIRVFAYGDQQHAHFGVEDNGASFSPSALEYYQNFFQHKKRDLRSRHLGLANVLQRLSLLFNTKEFYKIDSQKDKGTLIEFDLVRGGST
jgi:sensor histidine kinase YesM